MKEAHACYSESTVCNDIVRVCILLGYAGLSSRQLQPYDIVFERITSLGAAYMCTYRSSSRQMEIDIIMCIQLLYKNMDGLYNIISLPVSLSFFVSIWLLAVEILLSISELVIPDTVVIKTYTHVVLASHDMPIMYFHFELPLIPFRLQMSTIQAQHTQHISSMTIPPPAPTTI